MFRFKVFVLAAMVGLSAIQWVEGQDARPQAQRRVQQDDAPLFPDLGAGLKSTEGCLGVESARSESGKQVIFAWFKDKESVLNWYNSDMHQGVMKKFFPQRSNNDPLGDIPDDSGPIMAIASITFSDQSKFSETQLPISQIAIELYAPLPGGVSIGGRFAPESLPLEGHKDYINEAKSK